MNYSTHLLDWYDYPFITWVIGEKIQKIINFNFIGFFNTNAFYPNTNTAYFTDLLLPQAILGVPIRLFTNNFITIFNFIFLITFCLNYISVFVFWFLFFKNQFLSFLGALFVVFSPYFFLEIGHFQMQSYWPFFFCLIFLIKTYQNNNKRDVLLTGLFCGIQFLASVYLGIFLLYTIALYSIIRFIVGKNKLEIIKLFSLIMLVFVMFTGYFIKGYLDTKNQYSMTRDQGEFIQYSAHVSDYIFTSPMRTFIHRLPIMNLWNSFNKHTMGSKASFPGFTITILALISLIRIKLRNNELVIQSTFNPNYIFFVLLLLSGIVFSWGPRINFNGYYAGIPSLYYPILKLIPFLESARAPSRWSFLLYFSIAYFALTTLNKIIQKRYSLIIVGIIIIIFSLEYIPLSFKTHDEKYMNTNYETITKLCSNNRLILLEVPITHFDGNGGIINGLNRVTKYELSSLTHRCNLVNGYSGYDLPSLLLFKDTFYKNLKSNNPKTLIDLLTQNNVNILKINSDALSESDLINYQLIYKKLLQLENIEEISTNLFLVTK